MGAEWWGTSGQLRIVLPGHLLRFFLALSSPLGQGTSRPPLLKPVQEVTLLLKPKSHGSDVTEGSASCASFQLVLKKQNKTKQNNLDVKFTQKVLWGSGS